jgi:hypothetical protein
MAGLMVLSSDTVKNGTVWEERKSVDSSTVEIWKSCSKLLRVTNLRAFIMLMRLGCSSGFCLTGH